MSTIRSYHLGPRMAATLFLSLLVLLGGEIGLIAWTYTQGQTQHQICALISGFGDQTQNSITTNSRLIVLDMRKNTPDAKADASARRANVKRSTDVLIRLRSVHC